MQCPGCGHEFAENVSRCPRCHRLSASAKRITAAPESRLIEFPRRARHESSSATTQEPTSVPAWRAELSERVRAVRAKRAISGLAESETAGVTTATGAAPAREPSPAREPTLARDPSLASEPSADPQLQFEPMLPAEKPAHEPQSRTSDVIVEAALNRVRRANDNASRIAALKVDPAISRPSNAFVVSDRQATARALEARVETRPEPQLEPLSDARPEPFADTRFEARTDIRIEAPAPPRIPARPEEPPQPKAAERVSLRTEESVEARAETRRDVHFARPSTQLNAKLLEVKVEAAPAPAPAPIASPIEHPKAAVIEPETLLIADEIEPCDYLEAEIRKVDRKLAAEFAKNESPTLAVHFVIAVVDMLVIAMSTAPFMILISTSGGFGTLKAKVSAALITVIMSFFYLVVTQALCGKTFGMMLTNTRVVNANTFESVSPGRALARTFGYYFALAPAAIGFGWALVNRKRRGWHDLISGTLVARDF